MTGPHTLTEASLGPLRSVGAMGGQGEVFHTDVTLETSAGPVRALFKRYHRRDRGSTPDVAALRRQIEFLTTLPAAQGRWLMSRAAWPLVLVDDVGFLMAEAPSRFRANLAGPGGMQAHLAKTQLLLNSDAYLARHRLQVSDKWRLGFLADVAETLGWLHDHGAAVGDFSCNNLLFALQGTPRAFLIDCDSAVLNSSVVVPLADTPEWDCPHEPAGSPASDEYKLALLVARLFAGSQTTRTTPAGRVPAAVARLTERALTATRSGPPSMAAWAQALREAAANASDLPAAPVTAAQGRPAVPASAGTVPPRPAAQVAPPTNRPPTAVAPTGSTTPARSATPAGPATRPAPVAAPRRRWRLGGPLAGAAAAVVLVAWLVQSASGPEGTVPDEDLQEAALSAPSSPVTPATYGPYATTNDLRLWIRSGPGTGFEIVGEVPPRSAVAVLCRTAGEPVEGPAGVTDVWDRVEQPAPGYVSDAWVGAAADAAVPTCA